MIFIFTFSLITIYFVIPHISKIVMIYFFRNSYNKVNTIYLSFDDGPNPKSTIQILNILKKSDIKATFFLLGKNIIENKHLVDRILNEGHQIGEHGFKHYHPWKTNPLKYLLDLLRSNTVFRQQLKFFPSNNKILFRPPYGKLNIITLFYIVLTNKKPIFWDIDPIDYNSSSGKQVADYILSKVNNNSTILLHDNRINEDSSSVSVTISALEILLKSDLFNKLIFKTF